MSFPLRVTETERVASKQKMKTTATLFRDGLTLIETYGKNKSWGSGLRGRVFVIFVDAEGRAIWATKVLRCTTWCSRLDACRSQGLDTFRITIPEAVAAKVVELDIVQDDKSPGRSVVDRLTKLIEDALKAVEELRPYAEKLGTLAGSLGT